MSDWVDRENCQYCGKRAKHFLFAAFVCDDEKCIERARENRGGPGGHIAQRIACQRLESEDE